MNNNNDKNNRGNFYIYSAAWDGKVTQSLQLAYDVTSNTSASGNDDDNNGETFMD